MPTALLLAVQALHVLPAVFWAGVTFVLVRHGEGAERLVPAQVRAGAFAMLVGAGFWWMMHRGAFGRTEQVLAAGVGCALLAWLIQVIVALPAARKLRGAEADSTRLRRRVAAAERVAAVLLAVTLVCMTASRYV